MRDSEISEFAQRYFNQYVAERIAGGETTQQAREKATREWEEYFPAERGAQGHRHYRVMDGDTSVGQIWIGPLPSGSAGTAWIYYVEIAEGLRGRGYGRAAMLLAEEDAR